MRMTEITMIPVEKISPHPENPRKALGDLTELTESIKASGILQNLTVIPARGGRYTVVIGHRRLAAAKEAGLAEVPCVVREMSPEEQLATMMAENVQRHDLTPWEQIQGVQRMVQLGMELPEIARKTGIREKTVRRDAFGDCAALERPGFPGGHPEGLHGRRDHHPGPGGAAADQR